MYCFSFYNILNSDQEETALSENIFSMIQNLLRILLLKSCFIIDLML